MTFTYSITSTDETILNLAKVRLELGDTESGVGVRPDGSNLSDEEITIWLAGEENDVMRTTARACEALGRMWTTVTNVTVGPRKEEFGKVSDGWKSQAKELRNLYGGSSSTAFAIETARTDGYSEAAEGVES
jgi:hypothetical protein